MTSQARPSFSTTVSTNASLRRKRSEFQTVGGLHKDDFSWASENEPSGYVFICFKREVDHYHWQAIYELNHGQFP